MQESQLIKLDKEFDTCKNCGKQFEEGFEFCPHCGQKSNDELTLGVLFYNTITNYFSFDARLFKSYLPLMLKPGFLANQFIEGKRLLYLHPAQMYLFISVLFFSLFSFVARESTQEFDKALKYGFDTVKVAKDSIQSNLLLDSLETENILSPIKEDNIVTGTDGFKELDSILKTNKDKPVVRTSLDFDDKKIDSLIAVGSPDAEIYKAMGLKDDANYFTQKLYAQALKFYKQRNGGSILQAFYDSIPIAMFVLLPIFINSDFS